MRKLTILTVIPITFLFSCASAPGNANSKPEWLKKHPQALDGTNYNYAIGVASGSTREEATEKSMEDAYKKAAALRGGTDLRKTTVKYGIRCDYVVKENAYKYDVYVLLKYQIDFNGKKDFNEPDGLECETQIIESKAGKNDSVIVYKRSQQRQKTESLETIAKNFNSIDNLKHKNETWLEGKKLYDEINELQVELQNLNAGEDLKSTIQIYNDMRDNCIAHSKTAKLHWNLELENAYSNIAFSKLSQNLKMEKSVCKGDGISLVYKDKEPECKRQYGVFVCSYASNLSIASCKGSEYLQLKSEHLEGVKAREDDALDNLAEKLNTANFWKEWERELNEWMPKCD